MATKGGVPSAKELMWPTLMAMRSLGRPSRIADINRAVVARLDLSDAVLAVPASSRANTAFEYNMHWARTYLKRAGLVENPRRGVWAVAAKRVARRTANNVPATAPTKPTKKVLAKDDCPRCWGRAKVVPGKRACAPCAKKAAAASRRYLRRKAMAAKPHRAVPISDEADVPRPKDLMGPTLEAVEGLGGLAGIHDINRAVAAHLSLSDAALDVPAPNGIGTAFEYNMHWARSNLKKDGLCHNPRRGIWALVKVQENDGANARSADSKGWHLQPPPDTSLPKLQIIDALIASGESEDREFKPTLRTNLHTGQKDDRLEFSVLKTLAAFLNTKGGTLVVGVDGDGTPLGVEKDGFANEDKMSRHLVDIGRKTLGAIAMSRVRMRFEHFQGVRILIVRCSRANEPVYVRHDNDEPLYIRLGTLTHKCTAREAVEYVKQTFS